MDIIYEELVHVKALSNLSSLVKKELASCLLFEAHPYADTISNFNLKIKKLNSTNYLDFFHFATLVFNQGDEPESWYIILKGSVDVSVCGKGIVATLSEGDDFGKISLVNNSPRYGLKSF